MNAGKQQIRFESVERARARAEKCTHKLAVADNRFAFFRFSSILILIALFFAYASELSTRLIFCVSLGFLLYFLVVSCVHQQIQKKQKMWKALCLSYQSTLARMERNFSALAELAPSWSKEINQAPAQHPYAFDLDVNSSFFLFLNSCTTQEGGEELLRLLLTSGLTPEKAEAIAQRSQISVTLVKYKKLLRKLECLKFNESLYASLQKSISNKKRDDKEQTKSSLAVTLYAVFSVGLWIVLLLPALMRFAQTANTQALIEPLIIYTLFLMIGGFVYRSVTTQAELLSVNLRILKEVVSFLKVQKTEALPFWFLKKSSLFKIKEYCFYYDLLSLRGNPIFWILLHLFFPFDAVLTLILERKNRSMQALYPVFQNELAMLDVTAAFARVQIENEGMHFLIKIPHTQANSNCVEWTQMGHPLIPAQKRVCNSFTLERSTPAILLTGSNMAGKSTFLRTLGVNVLLANMGAPVCATTFRAPHFKLLCAIRIDDSLSDGTSYFYAEVKRLRSILTALENPKEAERSLFLIDEIFKGTNNKERFIGSKSILYALFKTGAFGLVSTHDLALSNIEQEDSRLRNMHFREHIENGVLAFDYLLRDGPCPTTNALQIMKQEGIPLVDVHL